MGWARAPLGGVWGNHALPEFPSALRLKPTSFPQLPVPPPPMPAFTQVLYISDCFSDR